MSEAQQGDSSPTYEELQQINKELAESLFGLRLAVDRLYFAAYWHADRPVDEKGIWDELREAARIKPGQSLKRLGPDRAVVPEARLPIDMPPERTRVTGKRFVQVKRYDGEATTAVQMIPLSGGQS